MFQNIIHTLAWNEICAILGLDDWVCGRQEQGLGQRDFIPISQSKEHFVYRIDKMLQLDFVLSSEVSPLPYDIEMFLQELGRN